MIDGKKLLSCLLIASLVFGFFPTATFAAPTPFPDMEWSWYRYREAVAYLQEKDVIAGYSDGAFLPKQTINRAELLKIIFKGKSDVTPVGRRCFSDVNPDEWFAPYVCAAKNRGIVSGYPNGTFQPGDPVNFAEAIKIILNAYGHEVAAGTGKDWYLPFAEKIEEMEVLPQHSYIPWAALNRERAADLLWRMIRYDEERFNPRLSPGCGKAEVSRAPNTVTVRGVQRDFLLTVPNGYQSTAPVDLIVAFHGRTNSNDMVQRYMRLEREAPNAIVAYPAALKKDNGTFSWQDPGDKLDELRDIAFFDAIVETLADSYCIDMHRIAVVGHSLGAWFANSIACVRGGAVLASATVGGDSIIIECSGPASAFIAHNPKDTLASFAGAERTRELRLKTNACAPETIPGPSELNCVQYSCAGGSKVLWCPHALDIDERGEYYPHLWPRETAEHIMQFLSSLR